MLSFTEPAVMPADATAYLVASGAVDWPTDDALQQQAIQRGQRYIAGRYNGRWNADLDPVPASITYAIIEAALIEARNPGFFSKTYTLSEAKVLVEVKGIKWERVGGSDMTPTSTTIEGMIAPYLQKAWGLGVMVI